LTISRTEAKETWNLKRWRRPPRLLDDFHPRGRPCRSSSPRPLGLCSRRQSQPRSSSRRTSMSADSSRSSVRPRPRSHPQNSGGGSTAAARAGWHG
jgi:hypothetical protein